VTTLSVPIGSLKHGGHTGMVVAHGAGPEEDS
jgi:hypothetical protein